MWAQSIGRANAYMGYMGRKLALHITPPIVNSVVILETDLRVQGGFQFGLLKTLAFRNVPDSSLANPTEGLL